MGTGPGPGSSEAGIVEHGGHIVADCQGLQLFDSLGGRRRGQRLVSTIITTGGV